jgi:hypothetical protein
MASLIAVVVGGAIAALGPQAFPLFETPPIPFG